MAVNAFGAARYRGKLPKCRWEQSARAVGKKSQHLPSSSPSEPDFDIGRLGLLIGTTANIGGNWGVSFVKKLRDRGLPNQISSVTLKWEGIW